jgi:hypothetical protein
VRDVAYCVESEVEIVIVRHQRRRVWEVEQPVVGVGKLLGKVLGTDRAMQVFGNRAWVGASNVPWAMSVRPTAWACHVMVRWYARREREERIAARAGDPSAEPA